MKMAYAVFLMISGFLSTTLLAQASLQAFVGDNIPFFEHLFTTVAMSSGVDQQSYLGHLGLSQAEGQTAIRVAMQLQVKENTLRAQAVRVLSEKKSDMASKLAQIRSERDHLLLQAAIQLMLEVGADGSNRIRNRIQTIAERMPRRTGK